MAKKNRSTAEEVVSKRIPVGACITSEYYLILVLSEPVHLEDKLYNNDNHYPTHYANYVADKDHDLYGWGATGLYYALDRPMAVRVEFNEYIMADEDSCIDFKGVGKNKHVEKSILRCVDGGEVEETPYAIAKIAGKYIASGKKRSIFICNGPQRWAKAEPTEDSITHLWDISRDNNYNRHKWKAFYALDGFSLEDIYLGGGNRDLWHYNHKTGAWKALAFTGERNLLIQAICCANDGKVYIGGRDGMLAIGRDEEWEYVRLKHGRHINKIANIDGKIYIGTNTHTYEYKGAGNCEIFEGDTTVIWSNAIGNDKESIKKVVKSVDSESGEKDALYAIKSIAGDIIGTAKNRRIFIRKGPNQWSQTKPAETSISESHEVSANDHAFCALDGFSKEDIYLGGGDRDLWHYNLKTDTWRALDFSGKEPFIIQTICCADDGKIYVGGRDGMLAIGRDDEWEFVRLDHGRHIEQIVSFNGKIFIGTEAHTYVLNEEHQSDIYDFEGELNFTGGAVMDAAYGMLVIANVNGKVALHHNGKWEALHGIEA